MKLNCPNPQCVLPSNAGPNKRRYVKNGTYFRTSDSRFISRYQCKLCKKTFSQATFRSDRFQKKRRISFPLMRLLNSGVSQRRAAKILNVNPKTVVRRFRYLASEERIKFKTWRENEYRNSPLTSLQFDDLETAEHTKCKPLSVSLVVDPKTRKIVNFKVSQMPAKGLLAKTALRKYGYRRDERPKAWSELFKEIVPLVSPQVTFRSDENPHYRKYVLAHHPLAIHETTKGGRGSITGQGELKKLKFDPLFALNHTCAMLRANLNRLFRRTWCISKNKQGLIDHLSIYVTYHNQVLTELPSTGKGGS